MKLLFIAILLLSTNVLASAPMAKTLAPGYYRFMLGDFEVTALSDGTFAMPIHTLMTNTTAAKVETAVKKAFLPIPFETSVNAFLINTGSKLVLIDTGAGGLFGPTLARLIPNLKASGYQPEQIDEVYVTHLHNDHIGGLLTAEKVNFPNATVRADKHDIDYWTDPVNLEKAPAESKGFFQVPISIFGVYIKNKKVSSFEGDTSLVEGIKAVATHGHTPGHTVYIVESKGQKMVVVGDLIHLAALQFENPAVTIQFDSDSKKAAAQRMKIFSEAAKDGSIVAAAHISFPGVGHIRKTNSKFEWIPMNYTTLWAK